MRCLLQTVNGVAEDRRRNASDTFWQANQASTQLIVDAQRQAQGLAAYVQAEQGTVVDAQAVGFGLGQGHVGFWNALLYRRGFRRVLFAAVPRPFNPAQGTWQVVPFFHLFGSEENSSKAAPVQERIPTAYVALAKSEADRLGVNEGALLSLNVAGQTLRLPLRINEELSAGLVALPAGLAGIPPAIFGASVDGLQEAAQ